MKLKKIPYYFFLIMMVIAASTIIGLLSFTGFYVIFPILSLAIAAFVLSVIYEAEMYLQNIKGALNKFFFKPLFVHHYLAKEFLLDNFAAALEEEECPQFFKDYETELKLLGKFGHKNLTKESLKRKKEIEKKLSDMEKWFSLQLFAAEDQDETGLSAYEREIQHWLKKNQEAKKTRNRLTDLQKMIPAAKIFAIIAGVFMSLGMTYLLVDAFAVIPLLAGLSATALPLLVLPMAIIAGVAYTFLIYNALTDMILNDTLRKLYDKVRMKNGFTWRNLAIAVTAVVLLSLTAALTICTAGTWWTIAKHAHPLFNWMSHLPRFVMGIVNPIITGFSQLIFNLENTAETLEEMEEATQGNIFKKIGEGIARVVKNTWKNENWLQLINIPRILLKLTFVPLRLFLFTLHLVSIGLTADRVPGIPEILAAILGIICEGFEDGHYFLGGLFHSEHEHHEHEHEHEHHEHEHEHEHHEHEHGHHHHDINHLLQERLAKGHSHNHDADIPTKLLKLVFWPLFRAAAVWEYYASRWVATPSGETTSWDYAVDKQYGLAEKEDVDVSEEAQPSINWQVAHGTYRIDRHISKHLDKVKIDNESAGRKTVALQRLKRDLKQKEEPSLEWLTNRISEEAEAVDKRAIYNKHRLFPTLQEGKNTRTQGFVERDLPSRIGIVPAYGL